MSFKMRLASMNWNDKPNLLKVCCHSAAEAVPSTPALHVGSHRGRFQTWFLYSSIQSGSKHQQVEARCAQKWQMQWYGTFKQHKNLPFNASLAQKVATCNTTGAAPCADSQDTPGRWISALGSSRHGTQSSHVAPARNASCNVMCNVMCHVIATLMVMWLFKLRKPAGKLASCYSRTKWGGGR